ncbi:hypothetical protein L208DRAFT_1374312 [Tricholoma matsutake]|nr:hypothetical protein L208DRAFT_1374312 [Tricholoma matsutake 945]
MASVQDKIEGFNNNICRIIQSLPPGCHHECAKQQFFFVPPTITEKRKKANKSKAHHKKQKTSAGEQEAPDGSEGNGSPKPALKLTMYIDIKWKFNIPANLQAKNLSNSVGFKAMISSTVEHKKNLIVHTWDTREDDHVLKDKDLFDSIKSTMNSPSMDFLRNQIVHASFFPFQLMVLIICQAAIKENIAPIIKQLKMATNTGSLMAYVLIFGQLQSFDLIPHHASSNTNIKVLPVSKHFSEDKKLHLPQTSDSALLPISGSTYANPVDPMDLLNKLFNRMLQ